MLFRSWTALLDGVRSGPVLQQQPRDSLELTQVVSYQGQPLTTDEQARALSEEDRARLAETLLESLNLSPPATEATWAEEIERVNAYERGELAVIEADDVFNAGSTG